VTDLAIIAALSVTCLLVALVFVTVTFRQSLRDLSRVIVAQNARHADQMSALLDRFQAIRWEELASLRAIQDTTDEGGFLTPQDQRDEVAVEVDDQMRWSPASRLQKAQDLSDAEKALLAEDFPEDYPVREEAEEVTHESR
jgi:hypothetical protein